MKAKFNILCPVLHVHLLIRRKQEGPREQTTCSAGGTHNFPRAMVSIFSSARLCPAAGHSMFHQNCLAPLACLALRPTNSHSSTRQAIPTKFTLLICKRLLAPVSISMSPGRPQKAGWAPASITYHSTGTTPLFTIRSITRAGSEPIGAAPKLKSSRRGVYTGGIKHVLVTGEKEEINWDRRKGWQGLTGQRVVLHWLSSLEFFSDLMFLALLGVRKTLRFHLFF